MAEIVDWHSLRAAYANAEGQPKLAKYRLRKWARSKEFAGWIDQTALPRLTSDQAVALYVACGGAHRREFKTNPIEEIRESLDFLLYDTVKLEGRFQECADDAGAFKLEGAGKEFVSYLLCLLEPRLFAVWNGNAEKALKKLSLEVRGIRRDPVGIGYIDLLEGSETVRQRLRMPDFRSVDEFFYSVSRPVGLGGD